MVANVGSNPSRSTLINIILSIKHKINNQITSQQVLLIVDGEEPKKVPLNKAKQFAREEELDLVQVSENPPVCKIMDYGKYLYDLKKNTKVQKPQLVKEIRFSSTTNDHDFNFKLKHATEFLNKKDKVKAYVHFKGREIAHKELGELLLLKFAQLLEDYGKVESMPSLMGKRMFITISPK